MAATAVYEPGSVNKVITVAAALEEGLVSPSTELVVPDHLQVSDHLYTDHDPHPTESYSVTRILTESSNIGTIKLAQMLGKDRLDSYLRRFGFGTKTALDFPNEAAGHPPAPRRVQRHVDRARSRSARASPSRRCRCSRPTTCSPTTAMYVPPKLVLETVDGSRHRATPSPPADSRRVVSESTAAQMRDMLANVVAEGTGTRGGSPATPSPARPARPASPSPRAATRTPSRLPLRRHLRRVRARRAPRAVDHRGDRRAGRRHLRRHRRGAGLRRPGPVRPAPLPHPAAPRASGHRPPTPRLADAVQADPTVTTEPRRAAGRRRHLHHAATTDDHRHHLARTER